jgi:hypothetical protein
MGPRAGMVTEAEGKILSRLLGIEPRQGISTGIYSVNLISNKIIVLINKQIEFRCVRT